MDTSKPITRVVAAFDGSAPSRIALSAAIDEAARRDVPLLLVTAIDVTQALPVAGTQHETSARTACQEGVRIAAAKLGTDGVDATVQIGDPSAVLLRTIRAGDLAVCGTHGHRPVARMLLGSTSTTLAMHAPCPVMVVKAGQHPAEDAFVLVGVDGSAASRRAIRMAAEEAELRGVHLRALMAITPYVDALGFVSGPDEQEVQEAEATLSECLAGLADDHPDLVVRADVVQTHAVEALMRRAASARLVVVGHRGRGVVKSLVLGSVSRELLQRSPCTVLVVRPDPQADREDVLAGARAVPAQPRQD